MTGSEKREVCAAMCARIMEAVPDPAGWLLALRRIVEAAGLAPEKCVPLGGVDLTNACFRVAHYMAGNSMPMDRVRGAIEKALPATAPSPAAQPTMSLRKGDVDRERCEAAYDVASRCATGTPEEIRRIRHDAELAVDLHSGFQEAHDEVNRRGDVLAGFLMLRGGTNFLRDCRAAVAEKRWGDLVERIGDLEHDLVRDKHLRWATREDGGTVAEPAEEPHWHIPTNIDPGGPLIPA